MSIRHLLAAVALTTGILAASRPLGAQVVPMSGQCGLAPSNPCAPGAYLTPGTQGPFTKLPDTGGHTYNLVLENNGTLGGDYQIDCSESSTQTTCAASPATFSLGVGQQQSVTITYSVLGLGTHSHSLAVEAGPSETEVEFVAGYNTVFSTIGTVSVSGPAIVQHPWPGDGGESAAQDTFVATYWHSSGINQSLTKLWIDGVDSSSKLTGGMTTAGYKAPIRPASGYHSWKSKVCANNGRCDEYSTTFTSIGPSSFALDDSLPPTVNPLNTGGGLLGPLAPPDSSQQGCAVSVGDPEIAFKSPLGFLNQATPNGRIYVATIDTSHPNFQVRTETLAWLPNKSKTCDQLSILPRSAFDYSYFAALAPDDPHWASYPYGDLYAAARRRLDWLTGDPLDLAFGSRLHGPIRPPLLPQIGDEPTPRGYRGATLSSASLLLPDPGPIDSMSWKVWLNGVQVINNSAPVAGSGVTGITKSRLYQSGLIPITHPAFHTTTQGGWNEVVASIRDTLGHTTTVRARFVFDPVLPPGSPAALSIAPQRDFTHLDQAECAAFGAFQCEGITLAYPIPGFVTRDRSRDLHLVYRSTSQKTRVTVPLQLSIAKAQKAPDMLWVVPYIGGSADSARITRYAGTVDSATGPNATTISEFRDEIRIVASEVDTAPGQAAIRTIRHSVRSLFLPPISPAFKDDTVSQDVVQLYLTDSTSTRFGQGWQLAELGRLILTGASGALSFKGASAAIWASGDGSYTIYRKPASTWVSPPGETTRLVQLGSAEGDGTLYKLFLENGASIGFRSDGWQLWTRDMLGNATRYYYASSTSTRVDSILDPTGKGMVFRYFTTGKRKGYAQEIRVRRSATWGDTVTVATLNYDTVSNVNAVRLARLAIVRSPTQADTTRLTYKSGAPGAFVDSIIDPRHTVAKPVVTRFSWDTELWTPETITRPLNGTTQARQIWRRASPRIGYGRWNRTPANPLERTLQVTQWRGTHVPFAGQIADYQVDRYGGPTYVLLGPSAYSGLMGTNSATVRHVVRDTVGRPLRVVSNRYDPTTSDSVIYQYDAMGRVTRLIRTTLGVPETPNSRTLDTMNFTWDSVSLVTAGAWCSRLLTSSDVHGSVTSVAYHTTANGKCLPYRVAGPALDTTFFTYGNNNNPQAGQVYGVRPVKIRDPNGVVDSVAYHTTTWNSEYLVQPYGTITRAFYDGFGRADSIRDPAGKPSWFIRDRTGRVRFAKVGTGTQAPVTRTTYDKGGLVTETAVYPGGVELDTIVPSSAQKTTSYYDQLGRLDSIVNPGGRGISGSGYKARKESWATRDGHGNPRWEYPGNGSFVSRLYDYRGMVTRMDESQSDPSFSADGERFADTQATSWWTALGLPSGRVQSAGLTHQLSYDSEGRLATTASRDPFRPESSYVNQSYSYTRTGQLRSEKTGLQGAEVRRWYFYNRRGQRELAVDTTIAAGVVGEKVGRTEYAYDSVTGRLSSVVGKVGGTKYAEVSYTYDKGGRETQRVVKANVSYALTTTTSYDSLGRLTATSSTGGGTHYSLSSTSYNAVGDLLGYTSSEPGATSGTHTYTYSTDGTRRLLSAVEGTLSHVWTYDVLGNRLTENNYSTISGSPAVCGSTMNSVYDSDNRILRRHKATGGSTSTCPLARYHTDQAGRRLGEVDTTVGYPPYGGLKSVLTYTAAGRLYYSLTPSGDLSQNDMNWHWYDAQGRRVMSQIASLNYIAPFPYPDSVGGYRTYYIYDGSDVALELVRSGSTWSVDRRFLTGGLDRQLAGRFNVGGAYKNILLVADRGGSVVRALDSAGTPVSNPAYFPRNAYGALAGITGSGGVPLGGVGYAGAATPNARGGFVYFRNRWYDPSTGRFLTQDPIGLAGGVNLYAYAGNNPIAFDDPFGLECVQVGNCLQGEGGRVEARNLAAIATLHESFQQAARRLVQNAGDNGMPIVIIEGFRSDAKQASLSSDVTSVGAGGSYHNYGNAIDVYPVQNGQPVLTESDRPGGTQYQIGLIGEGMGLTWGGRWKKPHDPAHFQPKGTSIEEMKRLRKDGHWPLPGDKK